MLPNLGGEMDIRSAPVLAVLLLAAPLHAQQIRSATGPQPLPRHVALGSKASNLGAEPLNCQQHSDPRIRLYCTDVERSLIQSEARRQGMPTPSSEIVRMPAYGSAEAKQLGAACMGGTAMRRLSNGWEQLRNARGEWLRCRDP
ncbi:hypothetical protein N440_1638 [Stenotrophomonas sp. CC22-02]|nr:hypothetical protein N440_1638 [Stenotrophomonas sp. CC22-02]